MKNKQVSKNIRIGYNIIAIMSQDVSKSFIYITNEDSYIMS